MGFWMVVLAALGPMTPASAHGLQAGYLSVTIGPGRLRAVFTFALPDAAAHFHLDANGDGRVSPEEIRAGAPALFGFLSTHVTLSLNGAPVALTPGETVLTQDAARQEFLLLPFNAAVTGTPATLGVALDLAPFELLGQSWTMLVKVEASGQTQQTALSLQQRQQQFAFSRPPPLGTQLATFFRMGVRHIFLGYDHLMFLLALILIGGRLWDLVKIVTAFTIAHSVTLILAALQVVALPSRLVESGIALSIVYVAAENLFTTDVAHRWILTFCFGLVHGFGFASVLRGFGLPARGLVASLLAFNVGVEFGQVCVVALLFPATLWLSRRAFRRQGVIGVSCAILTIASGWLIERAFGLHFMPF